MAYMDEVMQQREADGVDTDYDKLRKAATKVLLGYLTSSDDDPAVEKRARTAQATLASVTRHEATKTNRQAVAFAMARSLAGPNRQQLEDYIRVTSPDAAIVRALPPSKVA